MLGWILTHSNIYMMVFLLFSGRDLRDEHRENSQILVGLYSIVEVAM